MKRIVSQYYVRNGGLRPTRTRGAMSQSRRAGKRVASGLCQGTAWYYARYRPGYPPEAIARLIQRFNLTSSTPVLDLGCGTGQIAIPLSARRIPVYAVDPDVEMLAEGLRAEQSAKVCGIAWRLGGDKSLHQLVFPPIAVCTMGSSFHWMDRDNVLKTLDRMIVPSGGVAVLSSGGSVWSDRVDSWAAVVKDVVVEFLGSERRAGSGTYSHPTENHEVVLARSPFRRVERFDFRSSQAITVNEIIGLQLSTSYASPVQLGKRIGEFRRVLKVRLLEIEPSGMFSSQTITEVLVATRSYGFARRPCKRRGTNFSYRLDVTRCRL